MSGGGLPFHGQIWTPFNPKQMSSVVTLTSKTTNIRHRYTSLLVFTARLWPQVRMPPVLNARRTLCPFPNLPISRNSERDPFRIYEHAQCRLFERTSLQRAYVMGSSAVLRARRSTLVLAASKRCLRRAHSIGRGCCVHTCIMAIGTDRLQNASRLSVLFESSQIFYDTQTQ